MSTTDEMTLREAGEILGVTPRRVQGMIRQGQLQARMWAAPSGRYQTVRRRDVETLLGERTARARGEMPAHRGPQPRLPSAAMPVPIAEDGTE